MTKEELVSNITEQLGTTQISERSINEMIDGFGLADNENVTVESLTPYVKFLKQTITGNISSVVASAVNEKNSQIALLQKQIDDLKKQASNPPVDNPPKGNEELDTLKAEVEALKAAKAAEESKAKISAVKSQLKTSLKAKLTDAKVSVNEFIFQTTVDAFDVKEDTKVSEVVKDLETSYLANLKAAGLDGKYQPRVGVNISGGEKTAVSDYFARKKAKEHWGEK